MRLVLRVLGLDVLDLELTTDAADEQGSEDHEVATTGHSSGFSVESTPIPSVTYEE